MYTIPIQLDQERELTLNFSTVKKIDRRLGQEYNTDFFSMIQRISQGQVNFDHLSIVYTYCLQANDPKLTEQKVDQLLSQAIDDGRYDITDLVEQIATLANESGIISKDQEATAEPDAPLASTSG